MTRQVFLKAMVTVVAVLGLLVFPSILAAQGNSQQAFERVKAVQEAHTDALMARPGVVGTAIGAGQGGQLVVVVLLERPGVAGIPAALNGVPVQVVVTGRIIALSHAKTRFRPVPIGVSTGHPAITAGTLGCWVTDGTDVYALSNNHVYANQNDADKGDNVLQPGAYDEGLNPDDAIGKLYDYEPIVFSRKAKNEIDAAIALISPGVAFELSTSPGGYGVPNIEVYGGLLGDFNGLKVQKFGRTTHLTHGEVTGVNATVKVGYGPGKTAKFVNQIVIEPGGFSDGGDSGSLIVTEVGLNPVGLLFAGSSSHTIANRIDLVLERFNVSVVGEIPTSTTGSIKGTVTKFSDGAPIGGATVTVDTGQSDTTAADGTYTIADVPTTGNRSVTASAAGLESQTTAATVIENETTIVDFALSEAPEPPPAPTTLNITVTTDKSAYKLKETVRISGQVTDEVGAGIEGATVTLIIDPAKGPNLTPVNPPVTDTFGRYRFDFKTSNRTGKGSYTVTATAEKNGVQSNTASTDFTVTK